MLVKISVKGLKEAQAKLGKNHRILIAKEISKLATTVRISVSNEVPKKTGKLAGGIHKTRKGEFSWHIYESHRYGLFIREGTIGHSIFPRKKKALMWPGLPHPVGFAAHPGIRHKNDYPGRAVQAANLENILRDLQAELVTELGG